MIEPTETTTPAGGAGDGIDALLSEFDQDTSKPAARVDASDGATDQPAADEAATTAEPDDRETLDHVLDPNYLESRRQAAYLNQRIETLTNLEKQVAQQLSAQKEAEDTDKLLNDIRGSHPATDKQVKRFILGEITENPAYLSVWQNREHNPREYQAMASQLIRGFAKEMQREPDPEVTEDRMMVAAAVRGASVYRPPQQSAPDYTRLSHDDFNREVSRQYGFNPFK